MPLSITRDNIRITSHAALGLFGSTLFGRALSQTTPENQVLCQAMALLFGYTTAIATGYDEYARQQPAANGSFFNLKSLGKMFSSTAGESVGLVIKLTACVAPLLVGDEVGLLDATILTALGIGSVAQILAAVKNDEREEEVAAESRSGRPARRNRMR